MKLILAFAFLMLSACDQKGSVENTKERAKAEQEEGAKVNNDNLAQKAQKMENDLRQRYRFFAAVEGNYEGHFVIGKYNYKLKLSLIPTLHLVDTDRVRTLEEIQDDFNNLMLIAQTATWETDGNQGIGGCVFDKVKPDIVNGTIQLASTECATRYTILLTTASATLGERAIVAKGLAKTIFDGSEAIVENLYADVGSKYNVQGYGVLLEKLK